MHDFGFYGGGWMMFIWWFLLIAITVIIVRALMNRKSSSDQTDSAMDILKKRYASGEIDKEEFEERKKDLL